MILNRKASVVTGGASGIGRAIVDRFIEEGAVVFVLDTHVANSSIGDPSSWNSSVHTIDCDVSSEVEVLEAISQIEKKSDGIDVLVNNAGINPKPAAITGTSLDQWNQIINVNLAGAFITSRAFIPVMNAGSTIINIASILGQVGVKECSAYSASKGGIIALTKAMARDHAPGIRVNCICPGAVETQMFEAYLARSSDPAQERSKVLEDIPLGRIGRGKDIANAVLFLASDQSSWITGSVIPVDGGDSC